MLDYNIFKPIRNLGLFIGVMGILGILFHFAFIGDPQYTLGFQIFVVFFQFHHRQTGILIHP